MGKGSTSVYTFDQGRRIAPPEEEAHALDSLAGGAFVGSSERWGKWCFKRTRRAATCRLRRRGLVTLGVQGKGPRRRRSYKASLEAQGYRRSSGWLARLLIIIIIFAHVTLRVHQQGKCVYRFRMSGFATHLP